MTKEMKIEGMMCERCAARVKKALAENGITTRAAVVRKLAVYGVELDEAANGCRGKQIVISKPGSKVTVVVTPTNEELMIARETVALTAK